MLPGMLALLALSAIYVAFGDSTAVIAVFAGEQLSRPVDQDLLGCGVGGLTVGSFD